MAKLSEGFAVIREAEARIQDLMAAAVRNRQYEHLPELAGLAERLAAILPVADDSMDGVVKDTATVERISREFPSSVAPKTSANKPRQKTSPSRRNPKAIKGRYPMFSRDDESLVKTGLSQKSGTTYEHRAAKSAIEIIISRIRGVASEEGRPFSAESLSDIGSHSDDSEIPGYQLYLTLAWLKSLGLLKQHGRKGYSIATPESFEADVEKAWSDLG